MSIKLELGALILTMVGASGFMLIAEPVNSASPVDRVSHFSNVDYNAFDRDFIADGKPCQVGIAKHRLCFNDSPLQTRIAKGEVLNHQIPVMAAEFPILVAVPPKASHQKLLRYGQALVLMNEDTKMVEDIMYLDETQV